MRQSGRFGKASSIVLAYGTIGSPGPARAVNFAAQRGYAIAFAGVEHPNSAHRIPIAAKRARSRREIGMIGELTMMRPSRSTIETGIPCPAAADERRAWHG
jgi:hypothetical protein